MKKVNLEFFRPEEELPISSQDVIIVSHHGRIVMLVSYSYKHKKFNVNDFSLDYELRNSPIYPDWWAYVPEELKVDPKSKIERKKQERLQLMEKGKDVVDIVSQFLQDNGFEDASKAIDCEFDL